MLIVKCGALIYGKGVIHTVSMDTPSRPDKNEEVGLHKCVEAEVVHQTDVRNYTHNSCGGFVNVVVNTTLTKSFTARLVLQLNFSKAGTSMQLYV